MKLLAVRDNEARVGVSCDELPEGSDPVDAMAAARKKYPPPKFEVVAAGAPSLEAFLQNFPRFKPRGKKEGKPDVVS